MKKILFAVLCTVGPWRRQRLPLSCRRVARAGRNAGSPRLRLPHLRPRSGSTVLPRGMRRPSGPVCEIARQAAPFAHRLPNGMLPPVSCCAPPPPCCPPPVPCCAPPVTCCAPVPVRPRPSLLCGNVSMPENAAPARAMPRPRARAATPAHPSIGCSVSCTMTTVRRRPVIAMPRPAPAVGREWPGACRRCFPARHRRTSPGPSCFPILATLRRSVAGRTLLRSGATVPDPAPGLPFPSDLPRGFRPRCPPVSKKVLAIGP